MLVIKNYIFPCIFCTIVLCCDLVAAQGQSNGLQALMQLDENRKTDISAEDNVVLTEGSPLQLQCNLSNVKSFSWQFEGKTINLTNETNSDKKTRYIHPKEGTHILKIKKANATTDPGVYRCIPQSGVYEHEFRDIQVWANPAILKMAVSINKVEGDSVMVVCRAAGRPDPIVWWEKMDGPLDVNDRIITTNGTLNATLEINNLESEDRDYYLCFAQNNISSSNFTVLIRVKDKLAALWPFLGICAEVAILCTIIFIYEKRRSKEEQEEEDPNREEKTVSNSNQKDKDIRQRK